MRRVVDMVIRAAIMLCGLLAAGAALGVFLYILFRGAGVLSLEFLLDRPRGLPLGTEGGVFPAIIGSLYLGALSGLLAGLLAIPGAVYLVFYLRGDLLRRVLRGAVLCLSGVPSILFGLVGYTMLVYRLGLSRSLLSASVTVAALIYPFVLTRVQKTLRERYLPVMTASLALGLPRSRCVRRLILPHALPEVLSGLMLGVSYGMGATAPVMFTGAVVYADVPTSLGEPFMALPYHLYILVSDGISMEHAYGAAFVLLALLLVIGLACRLPGALRERSDGGWRS